MQEETQGIVLVVDDIPNNISLLFEYLNQQGYKVMVAKDGESALEQAKYSKPDLILLDIMMPGIDGYETCRRLKQDENLKDVPVIFMSSLYDTMDKVQGFAVGAVDYITKPIQPEEVIARVNTHITLRALENDLRKSNDMLEKLVDERTKDLVDANEKLKESLKEIEKLKNKVQQENIYLQEEIKTEYNFEEIITRSDSMAKVLKQLEQVAKTDSTVLITGETGTGKELIARAIHNISNRRERSLVRVNCAALPSNLIESELFGHEKGAFTGAHMKKTGRFELADGGTIFLDEIGELPLDMQVKLLRVLQEGEFERLGSSKTLKVDVRVIAATNANLEESIKNNKFREDLFYRLNVFPLRIPPLRERQGDVPLLVKHFIEKFCLKFNKHIDKIPQDIMESLSNYAWHGNVRELENVIERSVILSQESTLYVDSPMIKGQADSTTISLDKAGSVRTLKEVEKEHILKVINDSGWVIDGKNGASKALGVPPSTLRDKMKKHKIKRPD